MSKTTVNKTNKKYLFVAFAFGIIAASLVFAGISLSTKGDIVQKPVAQQLRFATADNSQASADCSAGTVSKTVPVLSVTSDGSTGIAGNLTVTLAPGNSRVLIDTNPFTETDLQYSANMAVDVAKSITNDNATGQDFLLEYDTPGQVDVIGGGSAGAAATIAAIAALENKQINPTVAMTGTINADGTIGPVAGILQKAKAAADAGYKVLLLPKGQSTETYYEKTAGDTSTMRGYRMFNIKYVPKTVDIAAQAQQWGLQVKEVSTIQDAMSYMIM